jgi:hypothetical protein
MLGFSSGGVVYAASGFPSRGTDTVPAMLTPNERVLSVEQNKHYENMMRYGSSSNSYSSGVSQSDLSGIHSALREIAVHTRTSADKQLINNPYDSRIAQTQNVRTQLRGRY